MLRDGAGNKPPSKAAIRGAHDDLTKVKVRFKQPALIGMQEARQFVPMLRDGLLPGYKVALPKHARGDFASNAILYDPKQMHLCGVENLFAHGGLAGQYPLRLVTSADFLWDGDGSLVTYDNTHLNSRIDNGGRPAPLPRVKLSTKHIHLLADDLVRSAAGKRLAFGGGDFNIDEDADNRVDFSGFPNQIFREHGITSIYDELGTPASFDTHGNRKIDVIVSVNKDGRVEAVSVHRIDSKGLRTDHSAICAVYSIRLRK